MDISLSQMLHDYAVESGEIPQDPSSMGAEEITVITDDTQSELEENTGDLAEKVEKLENADASAEKIIETVESLESRIASLRAMADQNIQLTGPAVQMYISGLAASLEAREIPAQLFEPTLMAFQTSFESKQVEDYSAEAEEKTGGLLRRMVNMLIAAAKATATAITEFFTTLGNSGRAIAASGKKLERIGANVTGKAEGKVSSGAYTLLLVDGKMDPKGAVDDTVTGYTTKLLPITKKIRAAMAPALTALKSGAPKDVLAAGAKVASEVPAASEFSIAGGKGVYKPGEGDGFAKLSGASFKIERSGDSKEGDPLNAAEIKALGAALIKAGDTMITAGRDGQAVVKDVNATISAGEAAVKKFEGGTKEEIAEAVKVVKAVKAAVSTLKGFVPTYLNHLGKVSKAAYSYGAASAAKHKVEKAAAEPAAKKDDE